jgi:uncharacterized membrane protein YhaH (DUF805 family)
MALRRKERTMHWYLEVLKKYAVFEGRAGRKEYWYFVLFDFLLTVGLAIIDRATGLAIEANDISPLRTMYTLAVFLPSLAVSVRRLHDTGRSGWWILLGLIPCIGTILLFIWFVTDSDPCTNEFGSDPRADERRSGERYADDELDEEERRRVIVSHGKVINLKPPDEDPKPGDAQA